MSIHYQKKFTKVLEYIHLNLDGKLDIKTLAGIVFISEYHFHRLVKSFLGEPLGAYIKRIRTETGAKLLRYSGKSITEISYEVGFETPTSFNKSFKKLFGMSPSQFRKNTGISFESVKRKKRKTNFELSVTTKKIKGFFILCHPTKGELASGDMRLAWENLIAFCAQNNLIDEATNYIGIHWDDPSITEEKYLRYDACISIDRKIESPFPIKKIEGGNYLCFTYKGDEKYLGDVYDQIFRDDIIKNDIKLRNQPPFEQYLSNRNLTPIAERIIEIYIPV